MNAAESAALARADGGTTHCQWCEGSWVAPLEFVYSQASGESAPGGQGGELWRHQEAAFNGRGALPPPSSLMSSRQMGHGWPSDDCAVE